MLRTIIWFTYFWIYQIALIPKLFIYKKKYKNGNEQEIEGKSFKLAKKWSKRLVKLAGAKVTVKGTEYLPKEETVLFVANHQGSFDIPIYLGYVDANMGFVAKVEMENMPLVSDWMRLLHCVFIDRNNMRQGVKTIGETIKLLQNKKNMIIFPEGTRSKSDKLGEFKDGAFTIAKKAGVNIVPVVINGSYKLLEQNKKIKKADVIIAICEMIETKDKDLKQLKQETIEKISKELLK